MHGFVSYSHVIFIHACLVWLALHLWSADAVTQRRALQMVQ